MARRMNLPPIPALARQTAELERLEALLDERTAARAAADVAFVEAEAADAAERVNAIRAERQAAPPTAPEAEAARDAAQQEAADAQAALDAALNDVRAQVGAKAPEMLAAIEADQRKARAALRRELAAARKRLGELEHTEAVAAWLHGAAEGSVRPFTGGNPLNGPPVGQSRTRFTAGQLLDALDAIVDILDQPAAERRPWAHADLRVAG